MTPIWSAIPSRNLLGRILRLPLRLLPKEAVFRIRRGPGKGMKWIAGSFNHGCWLGTWEWEKQGALARFIRPGMTVYDVGAHTGFYTLIFSRLAGPGRVVSFEPYGPNLRYLLDHVRLNGLDNVRIVQAALADRTGFEAFSTDRHTSENSLTVRAASPLLVPTLTLDDAIRVHGLPPPDLIKMDVEGAESRILEGARATIESHRPPIFIALHSDLQRSACLSLLKSMRYGPKDLSGEPLGPDSSSEEIYALPESPTGENRPPAPAPTPPPALSCVAGTSRPPARLNLGCGSLVSNGWVNVDGSWAAWLVRHPWLASVLRGFGIYEEEPGAARWPLGIRIHDVRRPLPFRTGSFEAVYASHLLEHLYLVEARRVLLECRRVLRPGGVLRIVVPDLREIVREYLESSSGVQGNGEAAADRLMHRLDMREPSPPSGSAVRKFYHALKDFRSHKWLYDARSLAFRLSEAGFVDVKQCGFRQSRVFGIEEVEDASRVLNGEGVILEGIRSNGP